MIRIQTIKTTINPKLYIQKLVDMLQIQNGQIVIKVQNGKFVHLHLQPSFKPEELEDQKIHETKN